MLFLFLSKGMIYKFIFLIIPIRGRNKEIYIYFFISLFSLNFLLFKFITFMICISLRGVKNLSNYEQFKANIDVYSSVTLSPSLSEGNHFVYVHSVSNPKFREGIEYDSVKQEFRIDFVRL